jgi:hypothetical protein
MSAACGLHYHNEVIEPFSGEVSGSLRAQAKKKPPDGVLLGLGLVQPRLRHADCALHLVAGKFDHFDLCRRAERTGSLKMPR